MLDWVGAGLMHSVAKPLTIAARTADRMLARQTVDEEVVALARVVRSAAGAALNGITVLRRCAGGPGDGDTWVAAVDEIVNPAIDQARQLHAGQGAH